MREQEGGRKIQGESLTQSRTVQLFFLEQVSRKMYPNITDDYGNMDR